MAGQCFGEVGAGLGPFEGRAPSSAGPFAAPSACEGDPDGERRSQGVAPSSEYFGNKVLRAEAPPAALPFQRCKVSPDPCPAANAVLQRLSAEPPAGQSPPSARCPHCRGAEPRGRAGLPPPAA